VLHLVSQSPIDSAVLARFCAGDDMVFLENALLGLLNTAELNGILSALLNTHQLYVLADHLAVRGMSAEALVQGISVIDYAQLVALTVKNPVIHSWT
jgi:tRNA 2-thiouridine synthesizing protein B